MGSAEENAGTLDATLMSAKQYYIHLDKNFIGTTELENSDAPMGVVFGKIEFAAFLNIMSGYDFFKSYCIENEIKFTDYPDDKLISAGIENLHVFNKNGIEITGLGNSISGMDTDVFEISIVGIPYSFYETEFPHHVKAYEERWKNE